MSEPGLKRAGCVGMVGRLSWVSSRGGGGGQYVEAVMMMRRFDMQQKWANPLMGWTSGKDTLGSQVFGHLSFDSP